MTMDIHLPDNPVVAPPNGSVDGKGDVLIGPQVKVNEDRRSPRVGEADVAGVDVGIEEDLHYARRSRNPICGCLHMFKLLFKMLSIILRVIFVAFNNLYCIPTYTVWFCTLYPLKFVNESLFWHIEGRLFHWLLSMVSLWSYTAGYHIYESGDKIDDIVEEETLVMANHQSTSDVPLLMAAFNVRDGLLPNLNWIMDRVFKFTNFGIVSTLHGDFFVGAGKNKRDRTIRELGEYLYDVYVPRARKWLVIFPEGGFLRKRRVVSQRYARKNNLPFLQHVTLPRMGAVQAIMDGIGPTSQQRYEESVKIAGNNNQDYYKLTTLKYVLDITIAYPNGKPLDIIAIITGYKDPCKIHVHYRVFPIADVPTSEAAFQDWLFTRYAEKERMLSNYYATGIWRITHEFGVPLEDDPEGELDEILRTRTKKVEQDILRMFILHCLFLTSTVFHVTVATYLWYFITSFF